MIKIASVFFHDVCDEVLLTKRRMRTIKKNSKALERSNPMIKNGPSVACWVLIDKTLESKNVINASVITAKA